LPLVTVVTPSYNQGRFIEETILSVLSQDYPSIEYLVIDGGSTDNTLDILHRYENRLTWVSEADRGQSHAINKGFGMAQGEILCWLNSDDKYEPGAISRSVGYLLDHPDIAMCYGRVNVISAEGTLIETTPVPRPFDLWAITHWVYGIDQASTFFRRKALDHVGYIDEELQWAMDWDLWIRIGSKFPIAALDATIASIRLYYGTKTTTGGLKRIAEITAVMRKYTNRSLLFAILRASSGMIHMALKYGHPNLYRYLRRTVYYVKNRLLDNFYKRFQGVFQDGWLGRRARFMLRNDPAHSAIKFILRCPEDPRLLPNNLKVKVNGRVVMKVKMPTPGIYEVQLPYDAEAIMPAEIEMKFSKSLPPDSSQRRLTCRLEEVFYV
jgi:glycosyltransferase involved in cell wall biosynthesis